MLAKHEGAKEVKLDVPVFFMSHKLKTYWFLARGIVSSDLCRDILSGTCERQAISCMPLEATKRKYFI